MRLLLVGRETSRNALRQTSDVHIGYSYQLGRVEDEHRALNRPLRIKVLKSSPIKTTNTVTSRLLAITAIVAANDTVMPEVENFPRLESE